MSIKFTDELFKLALKIHNGDMAKGYICGTCKRLIHAPMYKKITSVVVLPCLKCELKEKEPTAHTYDINAIVD